jgi:hypothetical protein
MKEDIIANLFENWLAPVEDIRDKISFQLHELFSFYEETWKKWEDDEDDIESRIV